MVLFVVILIGVCMGSFGNVLIDRLPRGQSLFGRSHCEHCKRALGPIELVPVLSWTVLRGKCRTCKAPIPVRLPLVEVASGVLAWYIFTWMPEDFWSMGLLFLGFWALLLIAVIDLRTQTIPDVLSLVVFIAGCAFWWVREGMLPWQAVCIGAGFFGLQWIVSRGRWVGSGDILLAGAIGALLGTAQMTIWALLISYIVGANIAMFLIFKKRLKRGDMVPFGPFLVIAAFLVLFLGDALPPILPQ